RAAREGDPRAYDLPRPLLDADNLDFSFSGLKTAVRYRISRPGTTEVAPLEPKQVADLAASFQQAVVDCLVVKTLRAAEQAGLKTLCVGGGVAANSALRTRFEAEAGKRGLELFIPPLRLCTDNAVMGAIAVERLRGGLIETLELDAYPGLVRKRG